jgi:hypothetical protein
VELFPARGFFSSYPLKPDVGIGGVKAGSAVLAEFADAGDNASRCGCRTWSPTTVGRVADVLPRVGRVPQDAGARAGRGHGREYFERIWIKLIKYMAGSGT